MHMCYLTPQLFNTVEKRKNEKDNFEYFYQDLKSLKSINYKPTYYTNTCE